MLHHKKTAIALTKIYRVFVGKDYIRFVVNLLVSGASVKDDHLLSKSSLNIINYMSYYDGRKIHNN